MATLHLVIDRLAETPLHRQISDALRLAILEGRLRPGQRIPSSRTMATELEVSRLPVLTAYEELLHEGYLEGRVGSGTFVSATPPDHLLQSPALPPAPRGRGGRASRHPSSRAREEAELSPFRMGLPALDQFPHAAWARLVARHAHALSHAQMAYGDPSGLFPLRAAIAEHLRTARSMRCEADQVFIVSGAQAALRLATAVLLAPGDRVAVEDPGYPLARAALVAGGATLVSVPVDDEGMRVASLPNRGGRVRAAYVTPSHQYPLGTAMTPARRRELLDWALRRDAWVLEDDYDNEYRYVDRPAGALQGMDTHDRVVYIGTFSTVLFPALRLGYLLVPASLWQRFVEAREAFDLRTPTLYQLALAEFLREGHYARHVRRMRGVYRARRNALLSGLDQHCGDHLTLHNADAGLHVSVLLSPRVSDDAVVRHMAGRGLKAMALSACYAEADPQNGLLLGFGGSTERCLLEATRVLGEVLRQSA